MKKYRKYFTIEEAIEESNAPRAYIQSGMLKSITDNYGIPLSCVKGIEVIVQEDDQILSIHLDFIPEDQFNNQFSPDWSSFEEVTI